MGYRPGAADPPFMGGGRVSSDMYLYIYIYICVYCCMYVLYDMRTYLCDYMFGCVEQMHVCVEQMHIISNDIYHDGDGCFGWILDGEYACFDGFLDGFGGVWDGFWMT